VINKILPGLALMAALAFSAQSAEAQRPVAVGLAAGLSAPIGDFADTHKMGWNAAASLGFNFPASAVGVRFEGFYNSFEGEDDGIVDIPKATIAGASANVLYHLGGQVVRPYVIGGVGAYNTKFEGFDSETDFGINAGLGFKFGLGTLTTFAEARLHTVAADPDDLQFIPITFGIEF
jgi:opacity protein-like surface antigen